jgi:hypothetical protein
MQNDTVKLEKLKKELMEAHNVNAALVSKASSRSPSPFPSRLRSQLRVDGVGPD